MTMENNVNLSQNNIFYWKKDKMLQFHYLIMTQKNSIKFGFSLDLYYLCRKISII